MICKDDVFFNDGKLCICAGRLDAALRGSEFNGERAKVLLSSGDGFEELSWLHMSVVNGRRCVVFSQTDKLKELPVPASELAKSLRDKSFGLLVRLAQVLSAIEKRDAHYLDYTFGSLPISAVWFLPQSGEVMILPSQMCRMIDAVSEDAFRTEDRVDWQNLTAKGEYAKLSWLCLLAYYALTGTVPLASADVKENKFSPIPARLFFNRPENDQVLSFIDNILSYPASRRDTTKDACNLFAKQFAKVTDGVECSSYVLEENPGYDAFMKKFTSKARKNETWRRKGTKITVIGLITAAVLGFSIWYVCHVNAAPVTRDMQPGEIVAYYYESLNRMDSEGMIAAFAGGVKSEEATTAATIYAKNAMKSAYRKSYVESFDFQNWIDSGKPAINHGDVINGVTDLVITQVDEWTWKATCTLWTNADDTGYNEDTGEYMTDYEYSTVHVFKQETLFSFKWNERGWYQITDIEVKQELADTIRVDFIPEDPDSWYQNFSVRDIMMDM